MLEYSKDSWQRGDTNTHLTDSGTSASADRSASIFIPHQPTLLNVQILYLYLMLEVDILHREGGQVPTYLSCTCEWGVSSADLCVSGSGELCVDPAQTW